MSERMEKMIQLRARVPDEIHAWIKETADNEHIPMSAVVRRKLIERYKAEKNLGPAVKKMLNAVADMMEEDPERFERIMKDSQRLEYELFGGSWLDQGDEEEGGR